MDERKAYGLLVALGNAVGEAAKADATLLERLRAAPDAAALADILVSHRGNVPEGLAREFAAGLTPGDFARVRAKLVLQAKMVARGQEPVSPEEAAKGPVKHR